VHVIREKMTLLNRTGTGDDDPTLISSGAA